MACGGGCERADGGGALAAAEGAMPVSENKQKNQCGNNKKQKAATLRALLWCYNLPVVADGAEVPILKLGYNAAIPTPGLSATNKA